MSNMITEDYVSFETAKLLKEKGFDEPCYAYWHEDKNEIIVSHSMYPIKNITNPCFFGPAAPILQRAMKWLRKIYSLEIYPNHDFPKVGDKWWFEIIKYPNTVSEYESETVYNTYEEACEAAIKYCLENLI